MLGSLPPVPGYDASMPSGIDHVVIAVADPDASAAELTEKLGLAFTAGGRHEGLGTFNRIAFLGDAYLELMGVEDPAAARGWAIGAAAVRALAGGGGFATYGLVDEAIRVTVPRLQANGSRIGPVEHGSRERPDGGRVEWLSAAPPELGPNRPPFLIKHLDDGAEWGADALAARRAFVHPLGSPAALERLDLAVPDPQALAADCYRDLGLEFWEVASTAVTSLGRHVIRLIADLPETTMVMGAAVVEPRTVRALGARFEVIPATLPLAATS
jgi:catechol 2,3-dioxygenase-like lactoylglutathione lyase family enzyme